jgi:hypothetical protein
VGSANLPLVPGNPSSVMDCHYSSETDYPEENVWFGDRCNGKRDATYEIICPVR